jgi:hypothetical protein
VRFRTVRLMRRAVLGKLSQYCSKHSFGGRPSLRLYFLRRISGKRAYPASRIDKFAKGCIVPVLGRCCSIFETLVGFGAGSGMRMPRIKITHNAPENAKTMQRRIIPR